jgi:hypothetical protein
MIPLTSDLLIRFRGQMQREGLLGYAVLPAPWSAEVTPNCFVVRDANGQASAELRLLRKRTRPPLGSKAAQQRVRRIAVNIAKLPDLLHRP